MGSQNLGVERERNFKFARDVTGRCMETQGSKGEAKD